MIADVGVAGVDVADVEAAVGVAFDDVATEGEEVAVGDEAGPASFFSDFWPGLAKPAHTMMRTQKMQRRAAHCCSSFCFPANFCSILSYLHPQHAVCAQSSQGQGQ